jgi:Subtilase family
MFRWGFFQWWRASMRTSVLLVSDVHPGLRASAESAAAGAKGMVSASAAPAPKSFLIDENFAAVALAGMTASAATRGGPAMAAPAAAPVFVVRGTIEVDRPEDIQFEQDGVKVYADPEIGLYLTCVGDPPVGNSASVANKLDVAQLHARGLTGSRVAVAIVDTGINIAHLKGMGLSPKIDKSITITPPGVGVTPGNYPVHHGTMCAFDALIAAPKATLIDIPTLLSTTPGGSAMSGFLSDALRAFSFLLAQITSPGWKYRALVVNNSWGMFHPSWDFPAGHPGRYGDNPNHPFNIITGTLAAAGADILFAAGNCGGQCPDGRCQNVVTSTITGANAHASVLTLAGCDVNDLRVGYSSQGPSIAGMPQNKPDITAYTHFSGSEAFGAGSPDSGTSAACPVAAGCVAALRTKRRANIHKPSKIFDALTSTATQIVGAGWNGDYGHGIIQPNAAATKLGIA